MKKWKKILVACLAAGMLLALMPASAWAAVARVVVEPTYVYSEVYNFGADDTALVRGEDWKAMTVTASDAGLSAAPMPLNSLAAYYDSATGKYGFEDLGGKKVIPAVYDNVMTLFAFSPGDLLTVCKGNRYGVIDQKGQTVIPFEYDYICKAAQAEDLYAVYNGSKWGVIDKSGKTAIPPEYDYIDDGDTLEDGTVIFWGKKGETLSAVSTASGEPLFTVSGVAAGSFKGNRLAVVQDVDTYKCGYIDRYGNFAVSPVFDDASNFVGELAFVGMQRGTDIKYAVINSQGERLTDYIYNEDTFACGGDGRISYRDDEGRYGFLGETGTVVIPAQYDLVSDFYNGIATVGVYDEDEYTYKCGLIDTAGNIVLPLEYWDVGGSYEYYDGVSDYVWIAAREEESYRYGLAKIDRNAAAAAAPVVTASAVTATPTSYPVILDGETVAFDVYALKDANGNDTNYFKLRDVAFKLNGTPAQFNVGWDGSVTVTTGTAYQANGSEMSAPFTGPQTVSDVTTTTLVNGTQAALETITLMDETGNGYTYYKLRDLGDACGFMVDWDAAAGAIVINTK